MWVFGYGSLIWDEWADRFGCIRRERATLEKYRRDFNKASVRRWGSPERPGPTLGLTSSASDCCIGVAFEFEDASRDEIIAYLERREGGSFSLEERDVVLADGRRVPAIVALKDPRAKTFLGDLPLEVRAALARRARGDAGSCVDYVVQVRKRLNDLGIH